MRKEYLIGKAEVVENTEKIRLEYYMTEETRDVYGVSLYGILIKKETREGNLVTREQGRENAITYSRAWIEKLIQILIRNTVTPMTMEEIIDEYITKEGLSA